jgi:hypothetical protein
MTLAVQWAALYSIRQTAQYSGVLCHHPPNKDIPFWIIQEYAGSFLFHLFIFCVVYPGIIRVYYIISYHKNSLTPTYLGIYMCVYMRAVFSAKTQSESLVGWIGIFY